MAKKLKSTPVPQVEKENNSIFYDNPKDNWYNALPYGFRMTFKDDKSHIVFLPISPSNLSIVTHFATNMIPTLYGTVEEHSDVRYYDISIEGTTGIAPKFSRTVSGKQFGPPIPGASDMETSAGKSPNLGRQSFSIGSSIPLGGFFSKTIGAIQAAKNSASDLINGSQKPNESGVENEETGYMAFHNLYKMLLRHKKDASGTSTGKGGLSVGSISSSLGAATERKTHPIVFFNYKDGNQYSVVVKNFVMKRSATDPLLYYYSITLRGYSLGGLKGGISVSEEDRLKQLGLDGVDGSSFLGEMKKKSKAAKGVLGAKLGGISVLGK